jgi:hypothetical protein
MAQRDLSNCIYIPTTWFNEQEPPINASNLNKIEQGIKMVADCVNELNTVIGQLENDMYVLQQRVDQLEQYVQNQVPCGSWTFDGTDLHITTCSSSVNEE